MRLYCGIRDWNHPDLLENYYPDDLPEEWRLAYYANEFSCVLIPASVWMAGDEFEYEKWREDTHPQFYFLFEETANLQDEKIMSLKNFLGGQFGGMAESKTSDGIFFAPSALHHANPNVKAAWVYAGDELNLAALKKEIGHWLADLPALERGFIVLHAARNLYKSLNSMRLMLELMGH